MAEGKKGLAKEENTLRLEAVHSRGRGEGVCSNTLCQLHRQRVLLSACVAGA